MKLSSAPEFRPEIDGLRAIAVLSVLLYHFNLPGLRGGFVGVDVFFVISGFLIGGALWREAQSTSKIALLGFYIRRIKRLAPAYCAMALVSLVVGFFVLLPFEFRDFAKSLIAATLYLSNVKFFREAGYFDTTSEDKVLLHTWSLSVEEQFYIVLPIVMILLLRYAGTLRAVLWSAAVLSALACILMTKSHQTATFYLFPFRAWELLAGVLLAIEAARRDFTFSLGPVLSYLGGALILGGCFWIPAGGGFPGALALIPVAGAALVIANGRNANWVNMALSHPVPVAIGAISYSLYLWHWPVLTLSRYHFGPYATASDTLIWIAVSFGLAFISWKYVETPVRRSVKIRPAQVLGGFALASMLLIGAGGVVFIKNGMISRFDAQKRAHIEATADFLQDWSRCSVPTEGAFAGVEICPIGPEGPARLVIWGDSHLRALKEGLEQAAYEHNTPALVIWQAGCAPVFGLSKSENSSTPAQNEACRRANAQIEHALIAQPFEKVLLLARWAYHASGQGLGRDVHNRISLQVSGQKGSQTEQLAGGVLETARRLMAQGTKVFVMRPIPEIAQYDARQIARALVGGRMSEQVAAQAMTVSDKEVAARFAPLQPMFDRLQTAGVELLDPAPHFCGKSGCSALQDGKVQYFDNNHIVNAAARRIQALFDPLWSP